VGNEILTLINREHACIYWAGKLFLLISNSHYSLLWISKKLFLG
jgi:hypothetical protein